MAFPSSNWFRKLIEDALENTAAIDLNADTMKCALFTDSITGTFNFDTNTAYNVSPWNANEVSGTGYTAGGATLATPGVAISSGVLAFDEFGKRVAVRGPTPLGQAPGSTWREQDDIQLGMWLSQTCGLLVRSLDTIAAANISKLRRRHGESYNAAHYQPPMLDDTAATQEGAR